MKKNARPFLKWAGGKSRLLKQYDQLFPQRGTYIKYFEPFLGGGTVFFYLEPPSAVLSDLNGDLVNCYRVIKENVDDLIGILAKYQKKYGKDFFYELRDKYNDIGTLNNIERAAALLFLNKTAFNGIYRVNNEGKFNVPFGWRNVAPNFNIENIRVASRYLRSATLLNTSFASIKGRAKAGDFIYLDPPYHPTNRTSSFTKYTRHTFLQEEQEMLAKLFVELDERGCLLMLSNSDTHFIRNLYSGFSMTSVFVNRTISALPSGRKIMKELVIRNY